MVPGYPLVLAAVAHQIKKCTFEPLPGENSCPKPAEVGGGLGGSCMGTEPQHKGAASTQKARENLHRASSLLLTKAGCPQALCCLSHILPKSLGQAHCRFKKKIKIKTNTNCFTINDTVGDKVCHKNLAECTHFYLAYRDATCAEKTNVLIVLTASLPSTSQRLLSWPFVFGGDHSARGPFLEGIDGCCRPCTEVVAAASTISVCSSCTVVHAS